MTEQHEITLGSEGVKTRSVTLTVILDNGTMMQYIVTNPAPPTITVSHDVVGVQHEFPIEMLVAMGRNIRIDTVKLKHTFYTETSFTVLPKE
jgi:hypothetical protein